MRRPGRLEERFDMQKGSAWRHPSTTQRGRSEAAPPLQLSLLNDVPLRAGPVVNACGE